MNLTKNETEIINILRDLKPYEKIEITKDQLGRYDNYLVHRSQRIVLAIENKID